MDPKREKPSRTPMDCSSMMQQLMEKMRSSAGEGGPRAMCQRIMGACGPTSGAETPPEPPTSPEGRAPGEEGDPRQGCCGGQRPRAPSAGG